MRTSQTHARGNVGCACFFIWPVAHARGLSCVSVCVVPSASTFTFWDWLCGTDKPYRAAEAKRKAAIADKKVSISSKQE